VEAVTGYIAKDFRFSASHRLTGLPEGHKCARLHGHNYTVTLTLCGELDAAGMVLDYGEMAPFRAYLDDRLDHRHLGSGHVYDGDGNLTDRAVLDMSPTAENLAGFLLGAAIKFFGDLVMSVEVRETEGTSATAVREP
jgi:6-pyruvoyltetrahydropterin/6-carboxytetrahydropterin synthase